MALLKLPKKLAPQFGLPGRKPLPGSFSIDWSNPLTAHLKHAIIAVSKTQAYDFVTATWHTSTSSSSATSKYPDGIYINNDGGLGSFNMSIEKGTFVADATVTAGYSVGADRYLLTWAGSGELVRLSYNGFTGNRNWQVVSRGGFGSAITTVAAPEITSDQELLRSPIAVAGWDLDVGNSVDVGNFKRYAATGGASTNDTNARDISICSTNWVGVFRSVFVFDEDLPANVKIALSRDPYQLLKPKNDPLYFTPSAAGSTYTLIADVNALTLGSDAVALTANRLLNADVNALTLGSDAVTLTANRLLNADVNSLAIGGDDVDLLAGRLLTADVNALALGADDVTLTYNSGATYTLTADVNALTIGGDDVSFLRGYNLTADVNALTIGGDSVTLTVGVLNTPDCYTWLQSTITDAVFYNAPINSNNEYIVSFIDANGIWIDTPISDPFADEGGEFLQSTIDPNGVFLESCVCLCE